MDDFGNALAAPASFFGWIWSPFGLFDWRQIEDDDFI